MATVRRTDRWGKLDAGTPLKTLVAKLNRWMTSNDNAIVGGAKGDDALNTDAELTTNVTDAATIAGKPALGVAVTYASEFMETFDTTPASWITVSGAVGYTLSGTGQTGGKALRQTGSLTIAFPYALPYDGSKLHRLRARAKNVTGAGTFSFGLRAINSSGAVIGTYAVAASAATPGASYVEYTGWVKATAVPTTPANDPTAPSGMPSGTVGIQPYVVLNGGAPSGVMDLDYVSYERQDEDATHRTYKSLIPTTDPRFASGARVVADAVDEDGHQDASVTTPKIAPDVQIVGRLENVGGTEFIDLRGGLTAGDTIVQLPGYSADNLGNAVFDGEVAAASFTAASVTFDGDVTLSGNVDINGTVDIGGIVTLTDNLEVDGLTQFLGTVDFDDTVTVALGVGVTILGSLTAASAAITTQTGGSITITGAMTSNSVSTVNVTTGGLTASGTLAHSGSLLGFYGTSATTKPTVTGSRGGNAALASLLTALAGLGLLVDSSS